MNWQAISFDWNQVRAFLATAEEGSFSGAARALKTTQPTIGRQITALEEALGVTLVERSARGLTLTQSGRDLLDHVRAMGEAATLISMSAEGQSQEVKGSVTVTATDLLSAAMLPAILAPLRQNAPGISVRIVCSNDIQNLMKREADIAIRHMRPEQPELIARFVGDFGANLYGATDYLDRSGRPRSPREVADHAFVGNADPERLMAPLQNMGIPVQEENFVMSTDSGVVAWELTKSGFGISMQPEVLGEAEPGIERVFPGLPSPQFPVWLVTHRELQTSRRIRIVFDQLAHGLRETIEKVGDKSASDPSG
jgi:DNA-binding transcriptional LysR family regulator